MTARKLSVLFGVEPGEGRLVVLMLACSFLVGSSISLADTAAYAMFLTRFGAQGLPYVFMALSVVVTSLSLVYLKLSARLSLTNQLVVTVTLGLLVFIGMRLGLSLATAPWLTFALPVGTELANSFTRIAFWNLVGCVFNVRQAKRLIGLVGVGSELAGAIGGFVIPGLVQWMGTPNLFLAATVAVTLALLLILRISRSYALSQSTDPAQAAATGRPSPWWKNRYILMILGVAALYIVTWNFLDVVFYDQAALRFPSEDRLASFLGLLFGVIGLLNLLGHGLVTSPLLKRYGVRVGLLLTPVTLSAVIALIVAAQAFGTASALFWLVTGAFLLFCVTTSSIDTPVLNILYQPLPAVQRLQTQTLVEGVVYSLSIGLSGLAIWALSALWKIVPSQLPYAVLVLVVVWTGVGVVLGREYPQRLRQALARRRLGTGARIPLDGSTRAVLLQELNSPVPGVVAYALTTLETMGDELAGSSLPHLLDHPSSEVRGEVLRRLERLGLSTARDAVQRRLAMESSPAVCGSALRTLAALAGTSAFDSLASYLGHPEAEVRRGAMVGLWRHCGAQGEQVAADHLLQMASSREASERVLAAQTLGEVAANAAPGRAGPEGGVTPPLRQALLDLLRDPDTGVQQAALLAAGRSGLTQPGLWPLVVEQLGSRPLRGPATMALVAGGEAVLPALLTAFAGPGEAVLPDPALRRRIISVCGRIGGMYAVDWLKEQMADPDGAARTAALNGLCRCGYRAAGADAPQVVQQIKAEAALAAWTMVVQADLGEIDSCDLVKSALSGILDDCRARVLLLLAFLHDRPLILQARDNLSLASSDRRAYALELLDVHVPSDLKKWFFPLLADLSPAEKCRQMRALFPQPAATRAERVKEIIANRSGQFSPWLQACALYAAGQLQGLEQPQDLSLLAEAVAMAAAAPDPLVRETALWASRMQDAGPRSGPGAGWTGPESVGLALPHPSRATGETSMLTTVEKVLALKKAAVFAEVPDEILADLAACLTEVEVLAGQTVFRRGDLGDCMYIIADGSIRIHEDARTLDELGPGEVFGEMAVLDAEPRSASATASGDALLLRLDQGALYEVMEDRIEVARGIIRTLCRRLRARMRDLSQSRLEAES